MRVGWYFVWDISEGDTKIMIDVRLVPLEYLEFPEPKPFLPMSFLGFDE